MSYIIANPGVYLRELCEDLNLSTGVVQSHIWALVKNGEVEDYRNGRYRRFFGAAKYGEIEQRVISTLRQETSGKILLLLSDGSPLTHMELASDLEVTSQALSWQIGRLKDLGLVEAISTGSNAATEYRLTKVAQVFVSEHRQYESGSGHLSAGTARTKLQKG